MLVVAALAVNQFVEIWHHSENGLISDPREWMRGQLDHDAAFLFAPVYEGILCPWCFSVWVGIATVILYRWIPAYVDPILWLLAISRLANLINDLCHDKLRTPRVKQLDLDKPN
jgi:hypothetical protein